jgi:sigma-B regulation protein RsbU (phosphoserine phosphatase)
MLPGELLVLFSDGMTEAMNNNEEEFNEDRLKEVIIKYKTELPENLLEIIFKEVQKFCGNTAQTDDMTIVIIKRDE